MIGTLYSQTSHTQQSSHTSFQSAASTNSKSPEAASQDTVLNRLASNIPGMNSGDLKSLSADDFSPEKIADKIGGFVAQGLEAARRSGRSEEDVQKMYNAAVDGVKKGFAEAREILDGLGALSDSVASNIDATEEKTMDALAAIEPGQQTPKDAQISRLIAAERYQEAETLSLTVKTQDGDEVTINFSKSSQYEGSFGIEEDQDGNTQSLFNISRNESSDYKFSVEGDLDTDEIDALQNLIKDVGEISNEFFDGDVQKAFDMASEFRMDKTELSSMNLRLTQSEQHSAIAKYTDVENIDNPSTMPDKRLGHMMQNMQGATENPALGFIEDASSFSREMLSTLVTQDIRYRDSDKPEKERYDANMDSINNLLASQQAASVQDEG
ncbi:DUF5610 domain-containing protein [Neptunomonas antarctica]|uniref:DUF5610 domain-containing protein n=1 Tax=Neptunomonas antarctica TaxID=619304 RepID=A0A1N7P0V0_9GAMM|nr:DUF5610 domain-containing protein [Neptunomonas antarctica]SIT04265.1 hypothetical protein SAMN05421760_11212 [Neptunomonas antarctica]